jgi:hypothetical protein
MMLVFFNIFNLIRYELYVVQVLKYKYNIAKKIGRSRPQLHHLRTDPIPSEIFHNLTYVFWRHYWHECC